MVASKSLIQRCNASRSSDMILKAVFTIFLLLVFILFILLHNFINQVPLENQKSRWYTALPVEEVWLGGKENAPTGSTYEERESVSDLNAEVTELKTIKTTAINELRDIEEKRYAVITELKLLNEKKVGVSKELEKQEKILNALRNQLQMLRSAVASKEMEVNIPIGKPKQLNDITQNKLLQIESTKHEGNKCTFTTCFDHSHCSMLDQFSVFVYKPFLDPTLPIDIAQTESVYDEVSKLPHAARKQGKACIFIEVMLIKSASQIGYKQGGLVRHMQKLRGWKNNGQNHLLLFISSLRLNETCKYVSEIAKTKAVLATNVFCKNSFRMGYDILLSPKKHFLIKDFKLDSIPQLVPIKRTYVFALIERYYSRKLSGRDLLSLKGKLPDVYIRINCKNLNSEKLKDLEKNCNDQQPTSKILQNSVFNLLFANEDWKDSQQFFEDILDSLMNGAIPVIIGDYSQYPYSDFIDYKRFAIVIPFARLTEVQYILRTIKKNDVFSIRKHGRFVFETYFSSLRMNLFTVLSILQSRVMLPPIPLQDVKAIPLLSKTNSTITGSKYEPLTLKSSMFKRNWTNSNADVYNHWNTYPGAHYLFKLKPINDALPPSVQFFEDLHNYMPIGNGVGGDGQVFKNALGGDQAVEHFTVVVLTYDRELILIESLQRLANLRYLNRVIVIWNNKIMPSQELEWPDIGVPLHVIKGEKNSLNNRFIPFDLIDTEAILSMDDDIYLRFDEIELAFRVWRENRDRIVGFPGRYHSWNMERGWSYNASNSCELSMVLTGGAFLHKYYLYLYTYLMPQPIRTMVDDYMNCEDIAMNFLVSHVTGRPPVKVTSRWTFRCPGCPTSLSNDYTHYTERAKCLQFFTEIYGYMPLRRTQFRADSILFKTRLSPGSVKCYQFV